MVKRAFQKTGVLIDLDGYDKHLIKVPNFETYKPPEADEEYREEEFTKEEIAGFEQQEILYKKLTSAPSSDLWQRRTQKK